MPRFLVRSGVVVAADRDELIGKRSRRVTLLGDFAAAPRGGRLLPPSYLLSFTVVLGCSFAYPGFVFRPSSARRYFGAGFLEPLLFAMVPTSFPGSGWVPIEPPVGSPSSRSSLGCDHFAGRQLRLLLQRLKDGAEP